MTLVPPNVNNTQSFQRAEKGEMGDDTAHAPVGVGHMAKLPGFAENPKSFKKPMKKDPSIAQYISSQIEKIENGEN